MAKRSASAPLVLAFFFATVLTGLNRADAATTSKESNAFDSAAVIATAAREKILELSGASEEHETVLLFGVGAIGVALTAFTLYLLSLYFDKDPFLFNGGKMGELEARSIYTKKCS